MYNFDQTFRQLLDVYSVYWDARLNDVDNKDGGGVYLRILAVGYEPTAGFRQEVSCAFGSAAGASDKPVVVPVVVPVDGHRLVGGSSGRFGSFILSCRVPAVWTNGTDRWRPPLCDVQLIGSKGRLRNSFKVINTAPVSPQRDFTVCTPPLLGDLPRAQLTEFIELSRLLGASHVTFYDHDLSPRSSDVLEYYARRGLATVLPWKLSTYMDQMLQDNTGRLALTDCLYRNMALSKYVVFMDLNEYIVPYKWTNWHDMAQELFDTEKTCALKVNGVFFGPYSQYDDDDELMMTITNTWRTNVTTAQHTRSIVKPQMLFDALASDTSVALFKYYRSKGVDYPVAIVHHHQQCQADDELSLVDMVLNHVNDVRMSCVDMVRDDVIPQRYTRLLKERVRHAWQDLDDLKKNPHGKVTNARDEL